MINKRLRPIRQHRATHPAIRKGGFRYRHGVELKSGARVALEVGVVDPHRLAAFEDRDVGLADVLEAAGDGADDGA